MEYVDGCFPAYCDEHRLSIRERLQPVCESLRARAPKV